MNKHWLRAITAVSIAAVALAFAAPVRGGEEDAKPAKPKKHQFTGIIQSADAEAGTVAVKKGDETRIFKVSEKTKYSTADNKEAAMGDLKAGDKFTVYYTDDGGTLVANKIAPPESSKKTEASE